MKRAARTPRWCSRAAACGSGSSASPTVRQVDADAFVVSPHRGPNMVAEPVAHVRSTAAALLDAGATMLWLVTLGGCTPTRVEAVPLALDYCHTRLADRGEAAWISHRFLRACAAFGTSVEEHAGRLVVELPRDDDTGASPHASRAVGTRSRT